MASTGSFPLMYQVNVADPAAVPTPAAMIEYGRWQQMMTAYSPDAPSQMFAAAPSFQAPATQPVYAAPLVQQVWCQSTPPMSSSSSTSSSSFEHQPPSAAAPMVLDLSNCLNAQGMMSNNGSHDSFLDITPPGTGACTPEFSLRYDYQTPLQMPLELQRLLSRLAESSTHATDDAPEPEAEPDHHYDQEPADTTAGADDDISDMDDDHMCWDFDSAAAMHIRAQRDNKSYASSETSTAVSRTTRRRRGRRVAKGKAKSSMVILESPPLDEVLISDERKLELLQQMAEGGDAMQMAVSSISGNVLQMSLEPYGCRVVQAALDSVSKAEKLALASELHGHVRLATTSPHANFVIQKVVEVLPVNLTTFVAEELAGIAADVAQHRFGCRVLSRLVEHHLSGGAPCGATAALIDELLVSTDQLARHNFARHVLELVLEHGSGGHKHRIAQAMQSNAFYYARNRCASYVFEKALAMCNADDVSMMVASLLVDRAQFLALAGHECGMHVARAAVMNPSVEGAAEARTILVEDAGNIEASKYGKRLLEEIGHC